MSSFFDVGRITRSFARKPPPVELQQVKDWLETYAQMRHAGAFHPLPAKQAAAAEARRQQQQQELADRRQAAAKTASANMADVDEERKTDAPTAAAASSTASAAAAATGSAGAPIDIDDEPDDEVRKAIAESLLAAPASTGSSTGSSWRRASSPDFARLQPRSYAVEPKLNAKVRLWKGDITRLKVDAVVNAANSGLWAGGGICGAIFDAAGLRPLTRACDEILEDSGRVPPGETRLTRGFNLPAKFILHTVGPMDRDEYDLIDAYKATLDACINPALIDQKEDEEIRIRSVAMCCISTGIYGFKNEAAAHVALRTTREWLEDNKAAAKRLDAIVFCTFLPQDQDLYMRLLPTYFPVEKGVIIPEAIAAVPAPDPAARPPRTPSPPPRRSPRSRSPANRPHSPAHQPRSPVMVPRGGGSGGSGGSQGSRQAAAATSHSAAHHLPPSAAASHSPPADSASESARGVKAISSAISAPLKSLQLPAGPAAGPGQQKHEPLLTSPPTLGGKRKSDHDPSRRISGSSSSSNSSGGGQGANRSSCSSSTGSKSDGHGKPKSEKHAHKELLASADARMAGRRAAAAAATASSAADGHSSAEPSANPPSLSAFKRSKTSHND